MRPVVHPALVRVWRDASTIQIGLDPSRAVVLTGVGTAEAAVLRSLDGTCDEAALRSVARRAGGDPAAADRLVRLLHDGGVLIDADHSAPPDLSDPLLPDQASLGLITSAEDAGAAAVASRRHRHVEVRGAGRVGATAARLLAAAGLGHVAVDDATPTQPTDLTPGGHTRAGAPRDAALTGLLAEPAGNTGEKPDLILLCPSSGTARAEASSLLQAGTPHLMAYVVEATGVVGPLVLPGTSSCVRCHDLHRTDRDPAWPRVLVQADAPPPVIACDVTLAAQVAALAAQQALAFLDGFIPATVDGTVETRLPYGLPRRRSWRPHPACGCTWATAQQPAGTLTAEEASARRSARH